MVSPPKILLSFDVEEFDLPGEYGHPPPLEEQIKTGALGLIAVLDLLDRLGTGVRATFFTTAVFAQHRPDLITRILAIGRHELASHGWSHSVFQEGYLLRSKKELERISGRPVTGFRRARFGSFDRGELREAGYIYDSSINPIWLPGRYNQLRSPRTVYRTADGVVEIPISASPLIRYPLFWLSFKHTPMAFFQMVSRVTLAADGYLNLFFHPWEFTSLKGFSLPRIVSRIDGEAMVSRLETYLRWLSSRAEYETLGEFSGRFAAGR